MNRDTVTASVTFCEQQPGRIINRTTSNDEEAVALVYVLWHNGDSKGTVVNEEEGTHLYLHTVGAKASAIVDVMNGVTGFHTPPHRRACESHCPHDAVPSTNSNIRD